MTRLMDNLLSKIIFVVAMFAITLGIYQMIDNAKVAIAIADALALITFTVVSYKLLSKWYFVLFIALWVLTVLLFIFVQGKGMPPFPYVPFILSLIMAILPHLSSHKTVASAK